VHLTQTKASMSALRTDLRRHALRRTADNFALSRALGLGLRRAGSDGRGSSHFPIQVAAQSPDKLSWAIVPGLIVYLTGLAFESIGGMSSYAASNRRPQSKGQVMDRGLWRYTRPPRTTSATPVSGGAFWLGGTADGRQLVTAIGPAPDHALPGCGSQ